ncbi:MAG: hypothetical protein NZ700_06050, partial [Gemmataceae bacterium]|nr:hypothetical protein [Gemmataceae bacterium]
MGHREICQGPLTRRGFLLGAGAGLLAGGPLTWLGLRGYEHLYRPSDAYGGRTVEVKNPPLAMPGPYPGRVVEVHHPGSVSDDHVIDPDAVQVMVARGMCELTGADHPTEAWRRFFQKGDVVGIKVNPVGRKRSPRDIPSISSPAVVREIVRGLESAGVRPKDIIIFERYADEFIECGYETEFRDLWERGVRWYASAAR